MRPARREMQLIVACARTTPEKGTDQQIGELLQGELDWNLILRLAAHHKVMPLLYHNLNRLCSESVPGPILMRLQEHFRGNTTRSLFLSQELLRLLMLFEQQGITVVPYKGPWLAVSAYGSVAYREYGDLDLLVERKNLPSAQQLLMSHGYHVHAHNVPLATLSDDHYHYHFVRDRGLVNVEVHWAFTRRYWSFPLDVGDILNRVQQRSWAGQAVLTFSPEDTLLILCAHGAKHYWARIAWICDIAEFIRAHPEINWDRLVAEARLIGCRRVLLLGLHLARQLLGAELPSTVMTSVEADAVVITLAQQILQRIASGCDEQMHGLEARVFYLKMREHSHDRYMYLQYHVQSYLSSMFSRQSRAQAMLPLPKHLVLVHDGLHAGLQIIKSVVRRLGAPLSG